jgi:AhpD family alkylhydroperoxidase
MQHARLDYPRLAPKSSRALLDLALRDGRKELLGERLVELVNLRVSQINGCAVCVDMHWADLKRQGADLRHVNAVAAWREAPFFTERERAALGWAEKVALIPQADPGDAEFAALKAHFSDEEIAALGFTIVVITSFNLLNVGFRVPMPLEGPVVA